MSNMWQLKPCLASAEAQEVPASPPPTIPTAVACVISEQLRAARRCLIREQATVLALRCANDVGSITYDHPDDIV